MLRGYVAKAGAKVPHDAERARPAGLRVDSLVFLNQAVDRFAHEVCQRPPFFRAERPEEVGLRRRDLDLNPDE